MLETNLSPEPFPVRRRIRVLPPTDTPCGWIRFLSSPAPARRLTSEERAECAVIGAGFTGLAIARRLAELRPGWRIVVLDAQRAGEGASARSSGFLVDRAHFIARMEAATSLRYRDLCCFGIPSMLPSRRPWEARESGGSSPKIRWARPSGGRGINAFSSATRFAMSQT